RVLAVDRVDAQGEETYVGDLTRADEAEGAVAAVLERFGRLDVLFNGAGISGRSLGDGPVDSCTDEAWDAVLETNLKSVFLCSKHGQLRPMTVEPCRPEDVAGSALYLATAPFVTGAVLAVDGGWTAR